LTLGNLRFNRDVELELPGCWLSLLGWGIIRVWCIFSQ